MCSRLVHIVTTLALLGLYGCGSSEFSGGGGQKPAKQKPSAPPSQPTPTIGGDLGDDAEGEDLDATVADDGDDVVVPPRPEPLPENAVTKGSFTVWTIPTDPRPGQDYQVVIEVKLPTSVKSYTVNDLSGQVIGTDGYFQPIGQSAVNDLFGTGQQFSFVTGRARLSLYVPGAIKLVKDTIDVQSKVLKERQEISIIF